MGGPQIWKEEIAGTGRKQNRDSLVIQHGACALHWGIQTLQLHQRNILMFSWCNCGLGRIVGIATGYGLDGLWIESRWGARFSAHVQTSPGPHPASCTMGTGSFPGVKSGRGVTLTSPPSSAVVKKRVELYLYSPYGPYGLYRASMPVQGCTFYFDVTAETWPSCLPFSEILYSNLHCVQHFLPVQTGPGVHPASCKMGTGSFPWVNCGQGVLLTIHPLLLPRSWKSRAISLPTLWATPGL